MTCPKCKGAGQLAKFVTVQIPLAAIKPGQEATQREQATLIECPECKGTGQAPEPPGKPP
jgi:hypothetical protein